MLKAREVWPTTARVYCHVYEEEWSDDIEIIEETSELLCRRRGGAIDLLLDRPRLARSQFVFTRVKGREAIFWRHRRPPGPRTPAAGYLADVPLPGRSRSRSTAGSATRTSSPTKEPRRSGRPLLLATVRSTARTERSSRLSNGRPSRTWPARSPTERSRSRCNASPN